MDHSTYDFILAWNSIFPLDQEYRKKYHIPFGSKHHLKACQIDIMFDMLESITYQNIIDELRQEEEDAKAFAEGQWLKPTEQVNVPEYDTDFDNIDLSSLD